MQNTRNYLFKNYINELYTIEGLEQLSDEKINELIEDTVNNPYLKWIDIFPDINKENHSEYSVPIGFLIIGESPECHPDTDYYIMDTYIRPDYRRKHIMSEVVIDYIKTFGGRYSLFIASKNDTAKQFWQKVFERANYTSLWLSEEPIREPNPHFIQYGYKPK